MTPERLQWLLTHSTDDWEIGEDVEVVRLAMKAIGGEADATVTEDPLFYYFHANPGTVHCQRKRPLRATDDPLSLYEETIILLCKALSSGSYVDRSDKK